MMDISGALEQREMKYFCHLSMSLYKSFNISESQLSGLHNGHRTWLLSFWEILIAFFILCAVSHASYLEPTMMG